MEKLIIIRTQQQLAELQSYLSDKDFISYDTETTGVSKESEIIGFSVSAEVDIGYYVILSYWDPIALKLVYLETKEGAKDFLDVLKHKNLIMHNAVFDCSMTFNNFGVELMPSVHTDTMILGHLLDENRSNGLKELGTALYGEDARKEQAEMKESVLKNGGQLTKDCYELYKADCDLMARYGAKDAILTIKLFYTLTETLFEQKLDTFFYDDESMPLLRGPTYEMNTTGLKVDPIKLQDLKGSLESECMQLKDFIYKEITPHVKDKYPGTGKTNVFNINASTQLAWLLFDKLGNEFRTLTEAGRDVCKFLGLKLPYNMKAKREFINECKDNKDNIWSQEYVDRKTGKKIRAKKVKDYWQYLACGKETFLGLAKKYKWVEALLKYKKSLKLLDTYVIGIQNRMKYNVIRPNFLQHGTTSGRYSCKNPNFQNLPRDDKRIKACIIARPGKVFVGADYSQLEPRVFASFSNDTRLLNCFNTGEDFYSVIGMEVFEKFDCSPVKSDEDSFANKYSKLRDISKVVALSSTYGTTAPKMAPVIGKSIQESQEIITEYFEKFPSVKKLMLESHQQAMKTGVVLNLFGRPRRMPKAKMILELFGEVAHEELEYEWRNLLNLAINHRIQSTGASIMNRAAIAVYTALKRKGIDAQIVLQVHDSLIVECLEKDQQVVAQILQDKMENTVTLPGVKLEAVPKIGHNLSEV